MIGSDIFGNRRLAAFLGPKTVIFRQVRTLSMKALYSQTCIQMEYKIKRSYVHSNMSSETYKNTCPIQGF